MNHLVSQILKVFVSARPINLKANTTQLGLKLRQIEAIIVSLLASVYPWIIFYRSSTDEFFCLALKMSELINSWAFMQWSKSHILNYLSWISGFIWRFSHQSNERFEIEFFIASATKSISRFLSFAQDAIMFVKRMHLINFISQN